MIEEHAIGINTSIEQINAEIAEVKNTLEEHVADIVANIEQTNAEIAEVKKLNQVDKQNIGTQTLRLNDIEAKKIKELEAKISVIEEQTKDYTNQEDIKIQNIKDQVTSTAVVRTRGGPRAP